jgi:hypothetical protein
MKLRKVKGRLRLCAARLNVIVAESGRGRDVESTFKRLLLEFLKNKFVRAKACPFEVW